MSIKFSGKMRFMIILKVTKNQGFTVSLEDTFFEKVPPWLFGKMKATTDPVPC